MKKFSVFMLMLATLLFSSYALAVSGDTGGSSIQGIKTVATNVLGNLSDVAKLITALAFVAGLAFAIGGVVKFKAHKENPTQVQISVPIALLFVGAALIFIPGVFVSTGTTLFGSASKMSSTSGFSNLSGFGPVKQQ